MSTDRAELVLHPVRLRIVQALIGRELTTQGLAERLPEIAIATLYRHLRLLVEAGLLTIVSTRQVRGRTERTYALVTEAAAIDRDTLGQLSPAEMVKYLHIFFATLLEHAVRYLENTAADPQNDGFSYTQAAGWLDDDEFETFKDELSEVLRRYMAERPGPGRRRRIVTTVVLPDLDGARPLPGE